MNRLHSLAAMAALILCAIPAAGQSRLMMFVDTTVSLSREQSKNIGPLVGQILRGNREYERVAIYPLGSADQAPQPVFDEQVEEHTTARRLQLLNWDRRLQTMLAKHKNGDHTFLLDSVEFASKQIANFRRTQTGAVDLVFITDMIEDCPSTPLGTAVHLNKTRIAKEIEQAQTFPSNRITLKDTHVFVIVPADDSSHPQAPRLTDLEKFWQVFFSCCGMKAQDIVISRASPPDELLND